MDTKSETDIFPKVEEFPNTEPPVKEQCRSLYDFVKSVPGSRITSVTFSDGERWELGSDGKITKYKPQ
jgi:hypothetical protein